MQERFFVTNENISDVLQQAWKAAHGFPMLVVDRFDRGLSPEAKAQEIIRGSMREITSVTAVRSRAVDPTGQPEDILYIVGGSPEDIDGPVVVHADGAGLPKNIIYASTRDLVTNVQSSLGI